MRCLCIFVKISQVGISQVGTQHHDKIAAHKDANEVLFIFPCSQQCMHRSPLSPKIKRSAARCCPSHSLYGGYHSLIPRLSRTQTGSSVLLLGGNTRILEPGVVCDIPSRTEASIQPQIQVWPLLSHLLETEPVPVVLGFEFLARSLMRLVPDSNSEPAMIFRSAAKK